MRQLALVACLAGTLVACGSGADRLTVAAGTTLADSGLMPRLEAEFEAAHPGIDVVVVEGASATILELGLRGEADVVISHAPALEAAAMERDPSASRTAVFSSSFVLVGPNDPTSSFGGGGDVAGMFAAIALAEKPFVGRGDGSGTAEAEAAIWSAAGVDPTGADWYTVTGSGMGFTLQVADQREAFTLSELGAFLEAGDALDMGILLLEPSPLLDNPYSALVFADASPAASDFVSWLSGPAGADAVSRASLELFGSEVYRP